MKTKDVFDRFFCLWIAMVVAVQRFATQHPADDEKTDREKLLAYFRGNADQFFKVLEENPSNMGWLASS
jgi:hypothetical protein